MADFAGDVDFFRTMRCHEDPYAQAFYRYAYHGRVPFRTERGYLGLTVESTVVGDDVYLVEGAGTLYILRAKEDLEFADIDSKTGPIRNLEYGDAGINLEELGASLPSSALRERDAKASGDKTWQASDLISLPYSMEMEFNDREALKDLGGKLVTDRNATGEVRQKIQKKSSKVKEGRHSTDKDG